MSLNLYQSVKKSRPFKKRDLIIYLIVFALIACLFIFIPLFNSNKKSSGFRVFKNGELVLTYTYNNGANVESEYTDYIVINDNYITIYENQEKTHYNVLLVDTAEKSVCVKEANCSSSKDCTHLPKLKNNGGSLICVPHKLTVKAISNGYVSPTTG